MELFLVLCEDLKKVRWSQLRRDKCLFVLYGPPPGQGGQDLPEDYEDLPILGICGMHVDDILLCAK